MRRKDILSLDFWSREEIEEVLNHACELKRRLAQGERFSLLAGKNVTLAFYEPSTRTRVSFEEAAQLGGASTHTVLAATSSAAKGESLVDTARTLVAAGADALVLRHPAAGAPALVARHVPVPVINAGDGAHAHPTQSLLDAFTLWERLGTLDGLTVTIIGDIRFSRVARSNITAFTRLGARVRVAGPPTLLPPGLAVLGAEVKSSAEEALRDTDVVYLLRVQKERSSAAHLPSLAEYSRFWGVNEERLAPAGPEVLVLHPGPANIGVEVSAGVARSPQALFTTQVTNGVVVRLALLNLLLGGDTYASRS